MTTQTKRGAAAAGPSDTGQPAGAVDPGSVAGQPADRNGPPAPPSPPGAAQPPGSPASPSVVGSFDVTGLRRAREKVKEGISPWLPPELVARRLGRKAGVAEYKRRKAARAERKRARLAAEAEALAAGRARTSGRHERTKLARVEARAEFERAGRLAAGRRALGLAPVPSEFTRDGEGEAGFEVSGKGANPKEVKGLLAVARREGSDRALRYVPTEMDRAFVAGAKACGASIELIAQILRVKRQYLMDLFPVELSMTVEVAVISAGVRLLERALVDGDVGALRYFLTTHGGAEWREPAARVGATFGRDGSGREVVTFVVEGFSVPALEGPSSIDQDGRAVEGVGVRSER